MATFEATFAGRLLDNLQSLLESKVNNEVAALDTELPLFETQDGIGFRTPVEIATVFPCLYLEPSQSDLDQSADDSHISQRHEFAVSVSIVGPGVDELKSQIVKYVTAIDRAIRRASVAEIVGNNPTTKIRRPVWEVTQHRYGVIQQSEQRTIYRRDAQLILAIQMLER